MTAAKHSASDITLGSVNVARRVLNTAAYALQRQAEALDLGFIQTLQLLSACQGKVVCTGIGKSGHVARKIAATLASTGLKACFLHSAEASHGDLGIVDGADVVLALSRSGEAKELADILSYCKRFNIPIVAITAQKDSALGRAATAVVGLVDHEEATTGFSAPTTSTTLQMAIGDAIAVALLEQRGFGALDFKIFHPGGKLGAMLMSAADLMHAGDGMPLVSRYASMQAAILEISGKGLGIVGVVDQHGALCGVITDGDLRRHMEGLLGKSAAEVMSESPKTVFSTTLAVDALRQMTAIPPAVTALFVVEDGKPVGAIHVHDLLRAGVK